MTDRIQHIIQLARQSKSFRVAYHLLFWIITGFFYFMLFSWNSEFREATIIFSAGLLPVAISETYFFNYFLFPRFLWKKRYAIFFLYSFYTLLAGIWLSFLIVFYALIFILTQKAALSPTLLHPELQVLALHFIIFLGIAIKQVKRAFFMQQEKNELEKAQLTTELKLKEAELKLLKAQVHPHFLFNTLNNLYGLTLEKSDEAPTLVLQLSDILDYILYRCDAKLVGLSEELANLKNYIEIEKIRYPDKLNLTLEFPDKTENLKIAPLILLPFVENTFKHGVSHFPGVAFVDIRAKLSGMDLTFSVINTRNPLKKKNQSYSNGIGLVNVRKRLDLLYPEKYTLQVEEQAESFSVNLILELEL
ncbi:MAG: sensor histidine kinase [Draconibacterium sp.]